MLRVHMCPCHLMQPKTKAKVKPKAIHKDRRLRLRCFSTLPCLRKQPLDAITRPWNEGRVQPFAVPRASEGKQRPSSPLAGLLPSSRVRPESPRDGTGHRPPFPFASLCNASLGSFLPSLLGVASLQSRPSASPPTDAS